MKPVIEQNSTTDSKKSSKDKEKGALPADAPPKAPEEVGGRGGPDPTRFGDWEIAGKCVDF